MLRVGAKYQYLTRCAGCCFHTAEKWDAIFSRRRSFAAADVAAAIAPPAALSKNPADAQASVNPSKLKAAVARRGRRCDRWRRSAPKSCLQGIFTKPGAGLHLATGTRRHPSQDGNPALSKAYDISMRRFPWLLILSRS